MVGVVLNDMDLNLCVRGGFNYPCYSRDNMKMFCVNERVPTIGVKKKQLIFRFTTRKVYVLSERVKKIFETET